MFFKHIHQQFSFNRLLKLVLGLAFTLQLMIITYNHLSGFYVVPGPLVFLVRLLIGTSLSTVGGFLLAYPDLFFIRFLNRVSPWGRKTVKRVAWQLVFATAIAAVAAVFITVTSHLIQPYREGLTAGARHQWLNRFGRECDPDGHPGGLDFLPGKQAGQATG